MPDSTILTDPWIWVWNNALSDDFCDHLIDKFEKEDALGHTSPGKTISDLERGDSNPLTSSPKQSLDLQISDAKGWEEEDHHEGKHECSQIDAEDQQAEEVVEAAQVSVDHRHDSSCQIPTGPVKNRGEPPIFR